MNNSYIFALNELLDQSQPELDNIDSHNIFFCSNWLQLAKTDKTG